MRQKIAIKSSIIGLFSKTTSIILSFVVGRYFIHYLGVEINGINGVFSNVLGFLQLAELGIGSAIIYALYKPLVEDNISEVQILMGFYKKVYRVIGMIIIVAGMILAPFLRVLIVDSTYEFSYILLVFIIQLLASASTYFLAYKRNLLYADQRQYISTLIDASVNVLSAIIRIIVMVYTGSYVLYLIIQVAQNVISNIIVNIYCNKKYPYLLQKVSGKYEKMPELIDNVKNLMIGRLGGWVYNSTDNIIIARFVGIIATGLMANYYVLTNMIKTLVTSVVAPIQPMIGQYVVKCEDRKKAYNLFLSYTFIRYCIADIVVVGFVTMANPVVEVWLGADYIVNRLIVVLLAIDLFISITHGPTGEFIQALGLFRNDRNMSIFAMIINLGTSLIMVRFWGISGVLLGTVMAQTYYWIARGYVVFSQYFKFGIPRYLMKIVKYIAITSASIFIIDLIFNNLQINATGILSLIVKIAIVLTVSGMLLIASNFFTDEFKYSIDMVNNVVVAKLRNKVKGI